MEFCGKSIDSCIRGAHADLIISDYPIWEQLEDLHNCLKGNSKKMLKIMIKKSNILDITQTQEQTVSYDGRICQMKRTIEIQYMNDNDPKNTFIWTIPEKDIIEY